MFKEEKRKQIIQEMILVQDEDVLNRIDAILKKEKLVSKQKKKSALRFSGTISKKDAVLMSKAIEEGCEQIDTDGWN